MCLPFRPCKPSLLYTGLDLLTAEFGLSSNREKLSVFSTLKTAGENNKESKFVTNSRNQNSS
jgi:hypothetical protein